MIEARRAALYLSSKGQPTENQQAPLLQYASARGWDVVASPR
jgi:hypothetical protein